MNQEQEVPVSQQSNEQSARSPLTPEPMPEMVVLPPPASPAASLSLAVQPLVEAKDGRWTPEQKRQAKHARKQRVRVTKTAHTALGVFGQVNAERLSVKLVYMLSEYEASEARKKSQPRDVLTPAQMMLLEYAAFETQCPSQSAILRILSQNEPPLRLDLFSSRVTNFKRQTRGLIGSPEALLLNALLYTQLNRILAHDRSNSDLKRGCAWLKQSIERYFENPENQAAIDAFLGPVSSVRADAASDRSSDATDRSGSVTPDGSLSPSPFMAVSPRDDEEQKAATPPSVSSSSRRTSSLSPLSIPSTPLGLNDPGPDEIGQRSASPSRRPYSEFFEGNNRRFSREQQSDPAVANDGAQRQDGGQQQAVSPADHNQAGWTWV